MKNSAKASRVRYSILSAVFVTVVINYMDRTNISVAGSMIGKELHLDSVQMGTIFSAFSWTYATLQIPGGLLADRFGARVLYSVILILWSLATIILGFAIGFLGVILLRIFIGAFEAPSYPINNRIVTSWFPEMKEPVPLRSIRQDSLLAWLFLHRYLPWFNTMPAGGVCFFSQVLQGWYGAYPGILFTGIPWNIKK